MNDDLKIYAAIDLKSFYASVECVERKLDPLKTNLVVADESRTDKTICLAVSPSLKQWGIPGRPRLFEVKQKVKQVNAARKAKLPNQIFEGSSHHSDELIKNPNLELSYIAAPPRMRKYMEYSTKIYSIYLKYISPEDIHVYSIDEVFMDLTQYVKLYKCTAKELVRKIIRDVLRNTGITATAGLGTNLYLCKIAMDIVAKKMKPDKDGVRIAGIDEKSYRKLLWNHTPITDFWRIGRGYAKKLEEYGMYTMGDVARCSIGKPGDFYNEELLYRIFGVNAELLIDHAWGWEPCTIAQIKAYKPVENSLSSGQVLHCPYEFDKAKLIVREMTELLVRDLVKKRLVTDQLVLTVGYDIECLKNPEIKKKYSGPVTVDYYGRSVPKHAHGTTNLSKHMASTKVIVNAVTELFERIVNRDLLVRRMYVVANHVVREDDIKQETVYEQLDMFTDYAALQKKKEAEEKMIKKEKSLQQAVLNIEQKYGKNAILKGMNLEEGATSIDRNNQVGGHRA